MILSKIFCFTNQMKYEEFITTLAHEVDLTHF